MIRGTCGVDDLIFTAVVGYTETATIWGGLNLQENEFLNASIRKTVRRKPQPRSMTECELGSNFCTRAVSALPELFIGLTLRPRYSSLPDTYQNPDTNYPQVHQRLIPQQFITFSIPVSLHQTRLDI
jgi:hypothetical protein